MTLPFTLLLAWLALVAGLLIVWRSHLLGLWREPVFTAPILLVESDDWGAGPLSQAEVLAAIADCLERHQDAFGHPARMTLALILAMPKPDGGALTTLADPAQRPILDAIRNGIARGVFAPQLHGMTHFWPPALSAAATSQPEAAAWLAAPDFTESLPSPLQSRWVDTSSLPSRPLERCVVERAVAEETDLYAELLGAPPEVVVPPTFVWTQEVEAAWAAAGVRLVVTPGRRSTCRNADGKPACSDRDMRNGERGAGDVLYLVRDDYFEPSFGHRAEHALAALARKSALGRPCLLETHRWNFLRETAGDPQAALAEMDELYRLALRAFPTLRFASCTELGRAIRDRDPAWIERSRGRRFTIWLRRAASLPRFGKAARLTGLLPLLNLFARPVRLP
jgi:hypothetical protein